jgi:uncharacterized protein involved in response to NO
MDRVIRIEEPSQPPPRGFALFALGFRPFYLLAALSAAAGVVPWVAVLEGRIERVSFLSGLLWHQHEIVFGFAFAVVTGFLLTAGRVWSGRPTPTGLALALLAAHWIAARVLLVTGPATLAALVDGSFAFVIAAVLALAILGARNERNYFVVLLVAGLGVANVVFHLAVAGALMFGPHEAIKLAFYLILVLVVVMAGRVIPSFTGNALPKAIIRRRPTLDRVSVAATLVALGADAFALGAWLVAPAALLAAVLHAIRQAGWAPLATLKRPILWSLHAGHAWLPIGFALLALASLGVVAPSLAIHAFGLGAVGGMIIAMITRTALGHTARPLVAGRADTTAYALVHVATAVRVAAGLAPGAGYVAVLGVSGVMWSVAFLLYFAVYAPRLMQPRLDGKPG